MVPPNISAGLSPESELMLNSEAFNVNYTNQNHSRAVSPSLRFDKPEASMVEQGSAPAKHQHPGGMPVKDMAMQRDEPRRQHSLHQIDWNPLKNNSEFGSSIVLSLTSQPARQQTTSNGPSSSE